MNLKLNGQGNNKQKDDSFNAKGKSKGNRTIGFRLMGFQSHTYRLGKLKGLVSGKKKT